MCERMTHEKTKRILGISALHACRGARSTSIKVERGTSPQGANSGNEEPPPSGEGCSREREEEILFQLMRGSVA
ncbi:MAG: hypothetical protein HBSAPP03_18750 [Phycisphaerae bacterium]|nr:MAG: hypothetical protein HBSAPP03_18750 [Phycisphaerae bacterium]